MADQMKCPKCGGEMEEGAILTKLQGSDPTQALVLWGQIEKSMVMNNVNNKHEIIVHRCTSCGFLESYAK